MGRKAVLNYEQVKAVVSALRAAGAKPTIDRVWDALDRAGSKGTVHKLVKQCLAESEGAEQTPDSLRLLPHDIQQIILAFADETASAAREVIAEELVDCRREADSLASDNERLSTEIGALQEALLLAGSEKSAAAGRSLQLEAELASARAHVNEERAAAEHVRTALFRAELKLEAAAQAERELREARAEIEGQTSARIEAERSAAVLAAQRADQEVRLSDLKMELASSRDAGVRSESRIADLLQTLEDERQSRVIAERELAVLAAVQGVSLTEEPKEEADPGQATLWQHQPGLAVGDAGVAGMVRGRKRPAHD